ncbi:hypothetical protein HDV00_005897 [Rhizophlyctis rosea]|nr:hypothetical protein HDV00_005897 [Rhizophlyctis rosea]
MPPQKRKRTFDHSKKSGKRRKNVAPGRPYLSSDEDGAPEVTTPAPTATVKTQQTGKKPATKAKSVTQTTPPAEQKLSTKADGELSGNKRRKGKEQETEGESEEQALVNSMSVEAKEGKEEANGGDDEEEEGDDVDMLDEDELDDEEDAGSADEDVQEKDGEVTVAKTAKLANAIAKILATDVASADQQRPILSKEKQIERSIDEAKLDAKARKIVANEKRKLAEVGRVIPTHATTDYEKKLRKVATRGVVKLFNAIRVAQKTAEDVKAEGIQKNTTAAPIISKTSFLDMLKGGPTKAEETKPAVAAPPPAKNEKSGKKGGKKEKEEGVPWVKSDYAMKAPKHWDEEDEE